jgi:hypothetical protein
MAWHGMAWHGCAHSASLNCWKYLLYLKLVNLKKCALTISYGGGDDPVLV